MLNNSCIKMESANIITKARKKQYKENATINKDSEQYQKNNVNSGRDQN